MRNLVSATLVVGIALGAQGCRRGDSRAHASARGAEIGFPSIRNAGRVTLSETGTIYVGRPAGLAVDPFDGSLYVADGIAARVLRFAADGQLLRTYGGPGAGPGELRDPGAIAVAGDTVLVVDQGNQRVTRFGRPDGSFVGSARFGGVATSIQAYHGHLWFGGLNLDRGTSLAVWLPGERELRPLGTVPAEFTRSQPLAGIYTGVEVSLWGDTVVAGYMGLNRLTVFRTDGTPIRSISVPVRARKGEMPNVVRAMEHLDFPAQFSANSALFRMARLPSGNLALVHYDQSIDGDLITARVYLTLLSPDFSRACVDREIPVTHDAQPYTAFRGDTLFVVQQEVRGEKSAAFVDRWVIDELACPGVPARSRDD